MSLTGPSNARPAMRIGLVGTYPPRSCGLAAFTADVALTLKAAGHHVEIVALVDDEGDVVDPPATARLYRRDPTSYREAAARLNNSVDVVVVEHEFGIFGGRDGAMLSALTDHLCIPYAITLHTVTARYSAGQRTALTLPLTTAAAVLMFTDEAAALLTAQFPVVAGRCHVVAHGAPTELYRARDAGVRARIGLADDAAVMTTFGLLSPGKGIEHAIRAAAALRHCVDGLVYVVAGRTHPTILERHGERYRDGLQRLVDELDLGDVVEFRDWFHTIHDLADLLAASDVFVTPYTSAEQIVSGALSFAVAAGLPFVSTPYRYANQLASAGCGRTVSFDRPAEMATALHAILADTREAERMRGAARDVAATMSWPDVGRRLVDVLATIRHPDLTWTPSAPAPSDRPAPINGPGLHPPEEHPTSARIVPDSAPRGRTTAVPARA